MAMAAGMIMSAIVSIHLYQRPRNDDCWCITYTTFRLLCVYIYIYIYIQVEQRDPAPLIYATA